MATGEERAAARQVSQWGPAGLRASSGGTRVLAQRPGSRGYLARAAAAELLKALRPGLD